MSGSNEAIFGLGTTAIAVQPGATLATYFTQLAGQNSTLLKNGTGGTLWIIGMASGTTMAGATLGAQFSAHYLMGVSEVLSLDGPVTCYLANSGTATHIVFPIVGKSAGY